MADTEDFIITRADFEGAVSVRLNAGKREVTHVVPPAGEKFAYDRQEWARRIEVYISPTGRSARVWVDGEEVKNTP